MKDPYQQHRETCPYLKEKGHHNVVKGHNTCCCDDNVEVKERELKEHKNKMERWIEEIIENWNVVFAHQDDCSECKKRLHKIHELNELLAKDHEEKGRFIGRTPTGTFADDKCNCAEITCKVGCKKNHTHKTFSCEKCNPKVTLLDKIKKLLQ